MIKIFHYVFLGLGKIVGPFWFILVARHFRRAARNAVYNHVLQSRGLFQNPRLGRLNRLWQREPREHRGVGWALKPVDPWVVGKGFVFLNKIHSVKLFLLFWLVWVWCDDDSVSDTYDDGHAELPQEHDSKAFDHGDLIVTRFKFWPALRWNMRNTTMNYKYYFMNY